MYKRFVSKQLRDQEVLPVNDQQRTLTETKLQPYREEILEGLLSVRRAVDEVIDLWKEGHIQRGEPVPIRIQLHPYGGCFHIRDLVFDGLKGLLPIDRLSSFQRNGGILKPVYGIQHNKYFQNAIQAGGWILDTANDTVDVTKEKVVILSIEDSGMQNMMSFEHYSEIRESYTHTQVFPNI